MGMGLRERILEQAVMGARSAHWGREIGGDEDRDDERVDGDDARHDDGDQALFVIPRHHILSVPLLSPQACACLLGGVPARGGHSHLHDQVGPEGSHAGDADAGFGGAVSGAHA